MINQFKDLTEGQNDQKLDIYQWALTGKGHGSVEAVAGSGKTKTLKTLCKILKRKNPKLYIVMTAYNKKIADEIGQEITPNLAIVRTFHSLGLSALKLAFPGVQMVEKKWLDVVATVKAPESVEQFVKALVSIAKNQAVGILTPIEEKTQWYDLVAKHDLDRMIKTENGDIEELIDLGVVLAQKALNVSNDMCRQGIIDFDDMLYAPLFFNVKFYTNDWVFIDEAQDSNPLRRLMARKILKSTGRAVFVGDRYQAIYGFTGADNDSMERIAQDFNAKHLPLTVTFRCPKAVVRFAQQWVDHIEADESAPEGEVLTMDLAELIGLAKSKKLGMKDAILCRNTKPLVELAYSFIAAGVPCHVEGRDIGKGLLSLANRWKIQDARKLADKLADYRDTQFEKLMKEGKEVQAASIEDKVETLLVIIDNLPAGATVADLRRQIDSLFEDNANTLTLSTIHKSKGREWKRVFWLGRNRYQPSPYARQEWQKQQERNLMYVAATRAKETLVDVLVPKPPKRKGMSFGGFTAEPSGDAAVDAYERETLEREIA